MDYSCDYTVVKTLITVVLRHRNVYCVEGRCIYSNKFFPLCSLFQAALQHLSSQ